MSKCLSSKPKKFLFIPFQILHILSHRRKMYSRVRKLSRQWSWMYRVGKKSGFFIHYYFISKNGKKTWTLVFTEKHVSLSPGNSDGWVEKSFPVVATKDLTQARKSSARLVVWESLRRGGDTKIGKVGRKCPSVNVQIPRKYRRRRWFASLPGRSLLRLSYDSGFESRVCNCFSNGKKVSSIEA